MKSPTKAWVWVGTTVLAPVSAVVIQGMIAKYNAVETHTPTALTPSLLQSTSKDSIPTSALTLVISNDEKRPHSHSEIKPSPSLESSHTTTRSGSVTTNLKPSEAKVYSRNEPSEPPISEQERATLVSKQASWIEKHPGIKARYRSGKASKEELETAINELELIKALASRLRDSQVEQWASQESFSLATIDVPAFRLAGQ